MPSVTLPVDGSRVQMISTGKVQPAHDWSDGKRSDSQKRDPNTGMPIWLIDCVIDDDGASRSATAGVEVGSLDEPKPTKWQPVIFRGLIVSIYVDRAGRIGMRWSAEEVLAGAAKAGPQAVAS